MAADKDSESVKAVEQSLPPIDQKTLDILNSGNEVLDCGPIDDASELDAAPTNFALNTDLAATGLLDRLANLKQLFSHLSGSGIDLAAFLQNLKGVDLSKFGALISAYQAFASITSPIDTAAGISDRTKAALSLLSVWASMTANTTDDALVGKLASIVGNPAILDTISAVVAAVVQKMENSPVAKATIIDDCLIDHYNEPRAVGSPKDVGIESAKVAFDFNSLSAIISAVVSLIGLIRGMKGGNGPTPAVAATTPRTNFGGHPVDDTPDLVS